LPKINLFQHTGLSHGGNILAMAEKYHVPQNEWLDLSTGLNPNGWSVHAIPENVWQALPEEGDELQRAACEYYGCEYCLPVAGSQAAIQLLPSLRKGSKVGIISPTYAEHEHAWKKAGHTVKRIDACDVESEIVHLDVLVVVNPNNPTGEMFSVETLLGWHLQLSKKGGWLVVDEAFMDVTPELSLISTGIRSGLIILRSLGKFFGLAGVRCGVVITDKELLTLLAEKMGPWSVTGPSRYVATQALRDHDWHVTTRQSLKQHGHRLTTLLKQHGLPANGGTALFQWFKHPQAKKIFDAFARQGILLRLFNENASANSSLRFGLPKNEQQWLRLSEALNTLPESIKAIIEENKEDTSHA
jgi:cobalamin biosynthetic protein CobC